jgi:hypothetical protein
MAQRTDSVAPGLAQDVAVRLVHELVRKRREYLKKIDAFEDVHRGGVASYERGVAYGLNVALNALERDLDGS